MTLDEAIQHCEEKMMELLEKTKDRNASDPVAIECFECADEHRQLAEWLKDYKRLLELKPCDDAISRQAVLDLAYDMSEIDGEHFTESQMVVDVEDIQKLPSVTPAPKMGRWIMDWKLERRTCNICKKEYRWSFSPHNYCPNCGAKMEGVEE